MGKKEEFGEQISRKIKRLELESKKHKHMHRQFRYTVILLTALTSILAGVALSFESVQTEMQITILIIGAISGVVNSVEGIRRPFDLWIMERNVYYSLVDLKEEFDYEVSADVLVDIDAYHQRMQEILNLSRESWSQIVKKDAKTSDSSKMRNENAAGESEPDSSTKKKKK